MELFKIKKWNNLPKNELIRVHLSMKLYHDEFIFNQCQISKHSYLIETLNMFHINRNLKIRSNFLPYLFLPEWKNITILS